MDVEMSRIVLMMQALPAMLHGRATVWQFPPAWQGLELDEPIYDLNVMPSPTPAAMMGGGSRWDGTHAYPTIPNTGINPNFAWVVTVKSKQEVHLLKPPHPRSGY